MTTLMQKNLQSCVGKEAQKHKETIPFFQVWTSSTVIVSELRIKQKSSHDRNLVTLAHVMAIAPTNSMCLNSKRVCSVWSVCRYVCILRASSLSGSLVHYSMNTCLRKVSKIDET
eukprot:1524962-Amphidinium_carterae.1